MYIKGVPNMLKEQKSTNTGKSEDWEMLYKTIWQECSWALPSSSHDRQNIFKKCCTHSHFLALIFKLLLYQNLIIIHFKFNYDF